MNKFCYDDTSIHMDYDRARSLSPETMDMWMDLLVSSIDRTDVDNILDLGCGTGRFSQSLSASFDAFVHGVDPSVTMLGIARRNCMAATCHFTLGSSNAIPLGDNTIDLAFMSMTYHHLEDKYRAVEEVKRVLRASGKFCIRNSTVEGIDSHLWTRFFPTAAGIERRRLPRREEVVDLVRRGGFDPVISGGIRQQFAASGTEYLEKIGSRGLSSLRAVSDLEFSKGLSDMGEYVKGKPANGLFSEIIDIFVFVAR